MFQLVYWLLVLVFVEMNEKRCMCKFTFQPGTQPEADPASVSRGTLSLTGVVQRGDVSTPTGKLLLKYTISV